MGIERVTPPPERELIQGRINFFPTAWVLFFNQLFRNVLSMQQSVSADNGNAGKTLTVLKDASIQLWNTPLTATRTVTLSTTDAYDGAFFRIVRGAAATGAFNLDVGTGPLKSLTAAGQWVDVSYNGTAWIETASGAL